ncbi:MAG: chromate transporter [Chloroflexi bacterium]|nr:chromate transporter [Chloroflexota bacterium]
MTRPLDPSLREAFAYWVRLGFINFGGPAGQIALMHRELVDQRRWVSEALFLRALNFAAMLPGPEAQQMAIYFGWRMHGTLGGIIAGSFFVIPSILVMLGLSWLAVVGAQIPLIAGLLYGIQTVVIAIVVEAVVRIGKRTLRHPVLYAFAAAAFVALYFLDLPFPLVVIGAGLLGTVLHMRWPAPFQSSQHGTPHAADDPKQVVDPPPLLTHLIKIGAIFFVLWAIPVGALVLWAGRDSVLAQEALFFTQVAFVTIGGAYAVLSYISDAAVNNYGWLDAHQMVQGLGLAESTPGPLIMVTQYVGFLGAWRLHGSLDPLVAGVAGALITTYVTFLPCFMFVFAGAPYFEALSGSRALQAGLTAVTAAIVGVILNLAVFFAIKVLVPEGRAFDLYALIVAIVSYLALWRLRIPVYHLVPAGALAGTLWTVLHTQ